MGIIPLIIEGKGKSVVESREEFKLEDDCILILNLDRTQLQKNNDTNICYDLRVGGKYRDHRDREATTLQENQEIVLTPQGAVIIQTEEVVSLPRSFFGYILPKVSLLQKGISNTASKVDPGYDGHLLVTLFNLGRQNYKIRKGDKFCSLHLAHIDGEAQIRNKEPQQIEGYGKAGILQNISDKLREHDSGIKLLLILGTIILWIKACF